MKLKALALALLVSLTAVQAQKKQQAFLTIGNKSFSQEEFDYIFSKNADAAQFPISEQEYKELFVNYKLKVVEGQSLMLDTAEQYKRDVKDFYNRIARSYRLDTLAQREAVAEVRKRFAEEVDVHHILVRFVPKMSAADTLRLWNKLDSARQRVLAGEDFEKVAREVSEDPSVVDNGGHMSYFSAFKMVAPFEDMAFKTPKGEVSPIFRTSYGYHFIRVNDRRPYSGEMLSANIFRSCQTARNPTALQTKEEAKLAIDSAYAELKNGVDFTSVVMKYTTDKQSAANGGRFPWLGHADIIEEYANALFALDKDSAFSEPFFSDYGWHIVQRLGFRAEKPIADQDNILQQTAMRGAPHGVAGRDALTRQWMKKFNFQWNAENQKRLEDIMCSAEPDSVKKEKLSDPSLVVATFADTCKMTGADIAKTMGLWNNVRTPYDNFQNWALNAVGRYGAQHLELLYDDVKYTMQEYKDGLLVFDINEKFIWNIDGVDTTAFVNIYNANPARYSEGGTFNGDIYFAKDLASVKKIKKLAVKSKEKASALSLRVVSGEQQQGGMYDDFIWPDRHNEYVVIVGTTTNGTVLPYEKAKNLVIGDWQRRNEAQYIAKLKEKYAVK